MVYVIVMKKKSGKHKDKKNRWNSNLLIDQKDILITKNKEYEFWLKNRIRIPIEKDL